MRQMKKKLQWELEERLRIETLEQFKREEEERLRVEAEIKIREDEQRLYKEE